MWTGKKGQEPFLTWGCAAVWSVHAKTTACAEGGLIYHALNRANARLPIFDSDADYVAFERVLHQAVARFDMRLLAYCLMPNHFHLLLWPHEDGALHLHALAGHDPHPAFARPPPDRRDRPSVRARTSHSRCSRTSIF